tara:strand:+ start:1572 stop:1724 length:153 start_codon:yes stop_codon:yes gene_type:complete
MAKIIPIIKSNAGNATPGPKYAEANVIESTINIKEIKKIICILLYSSNLS